MKLLVATDAHIFQTPNGVHWCKSIYGYSFWKRYLEIFDEVRIVARVKQVEKMEEKKLLVDGPGVEVYSIPFYQGPKELLFNYIRIHQSLRNVDKDCDVAIFRMPSQIAYMAYMHTDKKKPIGGEIVYDPYDDLQKKDSLIVHMLNRRISDRLYKFCLHANGVSYVTEKSIQVHYPSKASMQRCNTTKYFETYYSSITLDEKAFTGQRDFTDKKSLCLALSSVAMNSDRKGEKVLIRTVKNIRDRGYDVSAVLIGDGLKRKEFEQLAEDLGISNCVKFTGMLASADEVRKVLLYADLFMFPTQAEGLPRGILEAMATGMPVLSTPVGGIPEVIDQKYLFAPDDEGAFSDMVCHLLDNTAELNEMSKKNFEKSKEFCNTVLQERRNNFYKKLKALVDKV